MPRGPPIATIKLPSCLIPESFSGSGDFEEHLNNSTQQPRSCSAGHDHRPQYFAFRLRDNAWHFYTTLSPHQQADYDLLVDVFRHF